MSDRQYKTKQTVEANQEDNNEYVYAIGHPHGFVKIGRSTDPQQRFQRLQTGSPYELWIIAQLPVDDPVDVESELHDHFSDKHVRGEWFDLNSEDYDLIADLMKMANSSQGFDSLDDYHDWKEAVENTVFGV